MSASLYIVGTPIGNLEDITLRAIRILKESPIIACENIPRTKILLSHLNIYSKRIIECSPANEKNSAKGIIQYLEQGLDVALVSDAGTPSVSDPGMLVVQLTAQAGFRVIPIPGVSALSTMLSIAGMGGENVIFTGFLSKKEGQILKTFKQFANKNNIFVVFVSCHRINKFIKMLKNLNISADISLGKELTKSYEHIFRGTAEEIDTLLLEKEKGEFVICIKFYEAIPDKQNLSVFSKKEKRRLKQLQNK